MRLQRVIDALLAPRAPQISAKAFVLVVYLHRWRTHHPHARHWPSRLELAQHALKLKVTARGVGTVERVLRELRRHHIISTRQRGRAENAYTLHPPSAWR